MHITKLIHAEHFNDVVVPYMEDAVLTTMPPEIIAWRKQWLANYERIDAAGLTLPSDLRNQLWLGCARTQMHDRYKLTCRKGHKFAWRCFGKK